MDQEMIMAAVGIGLVILIPAVLWWMTKRARELDAMPLSGLREQAEVGDKCFRANPSNVLELKITLRDANDNHQAAHEIGCVLAFKQSPTGRWKIETVTTRDTRDLLQAVQTIWSKDQVEIDPALVQ